MKFCATNTRLTKNQIGQLIFGDYPNMFAFCVEMLAYSIGAEQEEEDIPSEDSEKKN